MNREQTRASKVSKKLDEKNGSPDGWGIASEIQIINERQRMNGEVTGEDEEKNNKQERVLKNMINFNKV